MKIFLSQQGFAHVELSETQFSAEQPADTVNADTTAGAPANPTADAVNTDTTGDAVNADNTSNVEGDGTGDLNNTEGNNETEGVANPEDATNTEGDGEAVPEETTVPEETAVPEEGGEIAPVDGSVNMDNAYMGGGDMTGMDGMEGTTTQKSGSVMSSWPFVIGISSATLAVSIVLGILLAKKRIKKGFDSYED